MSNRIVLVRIATDPVVYLCSAVAPIIVPANSVDDQPQKYLGGGSLVQVPELEQVINGTAQRINLTLGGVTAATQRLFADESHDLQGAAVWIGVCYLDDDYQAGEVEWLGELRVDAPTMDVSINQRSIGLSIATADTDRSKAPIAFWTPADQARRSPTDLFFDHVPGLSSGTSRRFGPNSSK